MNKSILWTAFLSALLFSSVALADTTATCNGTLIITVGHDGPDEYVGVKAKFTMTMKKDKTATLKLENKFAPPITGTGKETGNEKNPWALKAKDADGMAFTGTIKPAKGYPGDTLMHMILELKSEKLLITGPMSCTMK